MRLRFFTQDAYDQLISRIDDNKNNYKEAKDWLPGFFDGRTYFKESSVLVDEFHPYYECGKKSDEQKALEDLTNTRNIYEAFKTLTPVQASHKLLWTYLCHANDEYVKYIQNRWFQNERDNTIKTRFFVEKNGNLLNDNALSMLWWRGYLTYDPQNKSDHFALTKILYTNITIASDVMDTLNRRSFNRIKGVLFAIRDFKEVLKTTRGLSDYLRDCNKYLNHYAAVNVFEQLDYSEIQKITLDYFMKLKKRKVA